MQDLRITWILAMILIVPNAQAQSGWAKEKNEGFFQTSFYSFSSKNYFTLGSEKLTTNKFEQSSIVFYGEYGISDRLTLITNLPLQNFNGFETTESVSGLGDLRLEFKYAVLKKHLPLAVSIAPEIPTGKANNFAKSQVNNFERINLPSGDGEFNVWTTVATSFALGNIPFYGSIFTSYNFRTQYKGVSFSDQVVVGIEAGYHIRKKVWVNARLNALTSVNEITEVTDFVRGDGTEYTGYSFGANIPIINNIHLSLNYRNFNDWIFSRKNIYSGGGLGVGIYIQFKPQKNDQPSFSKNL